MKLDMSSLTGILILAGNIKSCAYIGTKYPFALVPVPWDNYIFAENVSYMIHLEIFSEEKMKSKMVIHPYSEKNLATLQRGVGLRAWIMQKNMHNLIPFMRDECPQRMSKHVIKRIAKLISNIHPFIYQWPDKNDISTLAIKDFELMLLNHF